LRCTLRRQPLPLGSFAFGFFAGEFFAFGSVAFRALPFRAFPFNALSLCRESLSLCLLRCESIAFCLFRRRDTRSLEPLGVRRSSLFPSLGLRDACLFCEFSCLSYSRFRSPSYRSPDRGP